jgi:hypothetical protein
MSKTNLGLVVVNIVVAFSVLDVVKRPRSKQVVVTSLPTAQPKMMKQNANQVHHLLKSYAN